VGPTAVLDAVANRKILRLCRELNPGRPARSQAERSFTYACTYSDISNAISTLMIKEITEIKSRSWGHQWHTLPQLAVQYQPKGKGPTLYYSRIHAVYCRFISTPNLPSEHLLLLPLFLFFLRCSPRNRIKHSLKRSCYVSFPLGLYITRFRLYLYLLRYDIFISFLCNRLSSQVLHNYFSISIQDSCINS
jgi:hypothetical protein